MGYREYSLLGEVELGELGLYDLLEIYDIDLRDDLAGFRELEGIDRERIELISLYRESSFIDLYRLLLNRYEFSKNLELGKYRVLGLSESEFVEKGLGLRLEVLGGINNFIGEKLLECQKEMLNILNEQIYIDEIAYRFGDFVDESSRYFDPRNLFRLVLRDKTYFYFVKKLYSLDRIPVELLRLKHPIYGFSNHRGYFYILLGYSQVNTSIVEIMIKIFNIMFEDIFNEGFELISSEFLRYDIFDDVSRGALREILNRVININIFKFEVDNKFKNDERAKVIFEYLTNKMGIFVDSGRDRFLGKFNDVIKFVSANPGELIDHITSIGLRGNFELYFRNKILEAIREKKYLSDILNRHDFINTIKINGLDYPGSRLRLLKDRYSIISENLNNLSRVDLEVKEPIVGFKFYREYFTKLFEYVEKTFDYLFKSEELDLGWAREYMIRVRDCIIKLIGQEERYLLGQSEERFGPYSRFMESVIEDYQEYHRERYGSNALNYIVPTEFCVADTYKFFTHLLLYSREASEAKSFEHVVSLFFTITNKLNESTNTFLVEKLSNYIDDYNDYNEVNICRRLMGVRGSDKEKKLILDSINKLEHNNGDRDSALFDFDFNILKNNLGYEIVDFYLKLNRIRDSIEYSLYNESISILIEKGLLTNEDLILLKEILNNGINFAIEKFYTSDLSNQANRDLLLRFKNKLSIIVQSSSVMEFYPLAEKKDENLFKINHEFDYEGVRYRFRVLEDYDPYHFQVGADTNCCQYFGGDGQGAAIDSFINPLAGVVLLEAYNKDINDYELLCQSYFHYIPEDNGVILDNIERTSRADRRYGKDLITSLYKIYGNELLGRGFRYIYCGKAYTEILNFNEFEKGDAEFLENDPRQFLVGEKTRYEVYEDFSREGFVNLGKNIKNS